MNWEFIIKIHPIRYVILNFQDSLSRQEVFFVYFGFPLDWLHNTIRVLFCQYFLQLFLFIFHYFVPCFKLSDFYVFILMFTQYYTLYFRLPMLTLSFLHHTLLLTSVNFLNPLLLTFSKYAVDNSAISFYTACIFLI